MNRTNTARIGFCAAALAAFLLITETTVPAYGRRAANAGAPTAPVQAASIRR